MNMLRSFIEEPHNAVVGDNKGQILNLTDKNAKTSRDSILSMSLENPEKIMKEIIQIGKPASQMILFQDGKVSSSQNTKNNKNTTAPSVQLSLFPEFPDTQISA